MVHHGQNIFYVAQKKGYNKSELARHFGKTPQGVDYDMKKNILTIEVLDKYAEILEVPVSEFQKDLENSKENQVNYKEKYFELLEESKKLWQVVAQNGIQIPANFSLVGGYATCYLGLFLWLY